MTTGRRWQRGRAAERAVVRSGWWAAVAVVLLVLTACGGGQRSTAPDAGPEGGGVVVPLCARLNACNYLVGTSVSECVRDFDVCLEGLRPSLRDDWEQDAAACLGRAPCSEFWSCHGAISGCHASTSPGPGSDVGPRPDGGASDGGDVARVPTDDSTTPVVDPPACDRPPETGSGAEAAALCRGYCGYLEACGLRPADLSALCCSWWCFVRMTPGGEVDQDYQEELTCYDGSYRAFRGTPQACTEPVRSCGDPPALPRPPGR